MSVDLLVEQLHFLAGLPLSEPQDIVDLIERLLGPEAVRYGREVRLRDLGALGGWVMLIPRSLDGDALVWALARMLAEWAMGHWRDEGPDIDELARAIVLPTPALERLRDMTPDEAASAFGLPRHVAVKRLADRAQPSCGSVGAIALPMIRPIVTA